MFIFLYFNLCKAPGGNPLRTIKKWGKSTQERVRAEDQTERQKHRSGCVALSDRTSNTRNDHKIFLENPFKSKTAALFTNYFLKTEQASAVNMAPAAVWERLNVWKPLDVGFRIKCTLSPTKGNKTKKALLFNPTECSLMSSFFRLNLFLTW